jgi:hypothetical protein
MVKIICAEVCAMTTTTGFVSKKTAVVIAIVAASAISAVLAAAALAPVYASAFDGPRFGMHGGPPGAFGAGPFGYVGMPPWLGHGAEANWTGSIPLNSVQADVIEVVKSNVNVSVADAASAAEQSIGADSRVFSVLLTPSNGYLVYTALGIDSANNLHKVTVDAGNGSVLDSAQIEMGMMMSGSWKGHHGFRDGMQGQNQTG